MKGKKTLTVVAAVLTMVLLTAGIASAVTNGVPDGDAHPYVGLLVFDVYIPDVSPVGRAKYIYGGGKLPTYTVLPFTSDQFTLMAQKHKEGMKQKEAQIEALRGQWNTHSGCVQTYERLAKIARAQEAGQKVQNLTDSVELK